MGESGLSAIRTAAGRAGGRAHAGGSSTQKDILKQDDCILNADVVVTWQAVISDQDHFRDSAGQKDSGAV